jgi:DNA-binding NtrC family response regulator
MRIPVNRSASIVLIERNATLLFYMQDALTALGAQVTYADEPRPGLEHVHAQPPDLVVCHLTGAEDESPRVQRALCKQPDVTFVLITAHPSGTLRRAAKQLDTVTLLTPPMSARDVAAAICRVLQTRPVPRSPREPPHKP